MGTVKYSGPIASFHCPTEATIRSLKVHFSPKQLGEGTPSPENVRPIEGWDGVKVEESGKNLWGGLAMKEAIANNFPVISTDNNIITYSNANAQQADGTILFSSFKPNTQYTLILTYSKSTNVYTHIAFLYSDGSYTMHSRVAQDNPNTKTTEVYVSKANKTLTAIIRRADEYSNVTLYCDESGLFEGIITKSEFESYRGEIIDYEFGVLGKNKLDVSAYIDNEYVKSDGTFDTNNSFRRTDYLHLSPGDYIYSSVKNDSTTAYSRVCGYTKDKTFVSMLNEQMKTSGNFEMLFTIPNNVYYIVLQSYKNTSQEQIELGSTATAYEPYNPNKTVYGGWVDLISGEVCEEWSTPITYDGINNKGISAVKNTNLDRFGVSLGYVIPKSNPVQKQWSRNWAVICDKIPINSNVSSATVPYLYPSPTGDLYNHFFLDSLSNHPELTTDEEIINYVNTWLQDNPITIVYYMSNPNIYYLPASSVKTFMGYNNVWSNADYVEVEYDLHETQNILARKQFIIANQPHVETLAAAPLQNFVTDMAAPLKECKVHFEPGQGGEGNPSPDNVRPISGWNKLEIYRTGKNLLNPAIVGGPTTVNDNGSITVTGRDITGWPTKQSVYLPSGSYDFYSQFGSDYRSRYKIGEQGEVEFVNKRTISLTETTQFRFKAAMGTTYPITGWLQIFKSGEFYEESKYIGDIIPIDWTDEIGTVYGGYVDLINGEIVETYKYYNLGDLNPVDYGAASYDGNECTNVMYYIIDTGLGYSPSSADQVFADQVKWAGKGTWSTPDNFPWQWCINAAVQLHIVAVNSITGITDDMSFAQKRYQFKSWLQEHPMTFVVPRKTPIHRPLTPQTLKTLKGTNNIWSNANGPIEIKYWTH